MTTMTFKIGTILHYWRIGELKIIFIKRGMVYLKCRRTVYKRTMSWIQEQINLKTIKVVCI